MTGQLTSAYSYHAFISYSHAQDSAIAAALQREVRRFGVPFYLHRPAFPPTPPGTRRRPLRVFRDATDLAAVPGLSDEIRYALSTSRWLILMASPAAARSLWVQEEVAIWLTRDPRAERVLIALTDGNLAVDGKHIDAAATDAVPPALLAALRETPRWVDLRPLRPAAPAGERRLRIGDLVADFAAPIQAVDKDSLVGEHIRQRRRTLRTAVGALATVTVLAVVASVLAVVAYLARAEAVRQRDTALANQLVSEAETVADTQPGLARQLLAAARGIRLTPQVAGALSTGRAIPQEIHTDAEDAAHSPDGRVLATMKSGNKEYELGGQTHPPSDGVVRLYDTRRLTVLGEIPLGRTIAMRVGFVPGPGRRLAVAIGKQVRVWDVADPAAPRELASLRGHRDVVDMMAFSEQGLAATIAWDHELRLWNVSRPDAPALITAMPLPLLKELSYDRLAFEPGGRRLVLSEVTRGPTFIDLTDPHRPAVRPSVAALAKVQGFAYAPEGGWALTAGREEAPRRWAVGKDGSLADPVPLSLPDPGATITEVAYGARGHLAVVTEDDSVVIWNNARTTDPPAFVSSLSLPETDGANTFVVRFSPDGGQLMILSNSANAGSDGKGALGNTLRVWHLADGRQPGAAFAIPGGGIATHGNVLATATADPPGKSRIDLWDLSAYPPRKLGSVTVGEGLSGLAFSPSGRTITAHGGKRFTAIDIGDPAAPAILGSWQIPQPPDICPADGPVPKECVILSIVFRDEHVVAVGDSARNVSLFDVTRPEVGLPVSSFTIHGGSVTELNLRGTYLGAFCGGGKQQEDDQGRQVCVGGYQLQAFAVGGGTLAAADRAGTVRIWRVRDEGHELRRLTTLTDTGDVDSVALSGDGRRLATVGRDRTLRFYAVGRDRAELEGIVHIGAGSEGVLAFAGNDHTLASATEYGVVDVWELDADANARDLCAGSGERITRAQWARDVPDLPYEPSC
ncbi:hypothetical protein AB0368_28450 [Actinoplanes sp. NPDC051475]|uniref:hypothetical protein n=1 Tax=Actinoplanes sp. NPDC051475 TaxID=3157225 RepID=UPI00344CB858